MALNDSPPASIMPALAALARVTTHEDAIEIVELVPERDRANLVAHMAGRRTYRFEVMRAVVTSVDADALRRELGELRADNLHTIYA